MRQDASTDGRPRVRRARHIFSACRLHAESAKKSDTGKDRSLFRHVCLPFFKTRLLAEGLQYPCYDVLVRGLRAGGVEVQVGGRGPGRCGTAHFVSRACSADEAWPRTTCRRGRFLAPLGAPDAPIAIRAVCAPHGQQVGGSAGGSSRAPRPAAARSTRPLSSRRRSRDRPAGRSRRPA